MTPFVFLHGFTGSPASWDGVAASLAGARPLRPALLGHGAVEAEDVRSFGDEVNRLAGAFPREPVHLAGYSLGARLALGIALAHPERVARLTLVSGQPGLADDALRAERRRADARWCELLETHGIERFVDAWEAQPLFLTQTKIKPELRARHRAERLGHDPNGLARSLRTVGLAEMPNFAPELACLRVPVVLLAGELDAKFSALGREMLGRVAHARLALAPNAGHDLLLEAPDLVARELTRQP
ncbi:MAG TPA: alpha/beta fold hydrolase [Polyangiaceae bacterium]|nr:alpha/beta fold hydrolase [Polyangiaceae bacterium]